MITKSILMRFIFMAIVVLLSFCSAEKKTVMNFSNPVQFSTNEWSEIDSLIKIGQPNKALDQLNRLIPTLDVDKNLNHYLKAVRYKSKLLTEVNEDEGIASYNYLQDEVSNANELSSPLIKYIEAKWLEDMSTQSRRFYENDDQRKFGDTDFTEWGHFQYESKLIALWNEIYEESDILFQIPIDQLYPFIKKEESTQHILPTAFDYVLHEYYNFMSRDRFSVNKPKHTYNQWDSHLVVDKDGFSDLNFGAIHANDLKGKTLLLFQKWLKKHLEDKSYPAAETHADILRLRFLRNELGEKANISWNDIFDRGFKEGSASDERYLYLLEKAKVFVASSEKINHPMSKVMTAESNAHSLLTKAIPSIKDDYIKSQLQRYVDNLRNPYFDIQLENTYQPRQDILYRFAYKNIKEAKLNIYELSLDEVKAYFTNRNRIDEFLKKWKVKRTIQVPVVENSHLQTFSSEGKIKTLPLGFYAVYVDTKTQFEDDQGQKNIAFFQVTDLGLLINQGESQEMLTYTRSTGLPASGVQVDFYQVNYERNHGELDKISRFSRRTNDNGQVDIQLENRRSVHVLLTKGEDQYFSTQAQYFYKNRRRDYEEQRSATVFIDRGVYRPGQEVYFKVLRYNMTPYPMPKPNVIAGERLVVTLNNANGQVVSEKQLTTNDFGSASGSFVLPESGLNGGYSIRVKDVNGARYFSVEEYKRPKFKVEVNQPQGLISFGEKVKVLGDAISFSGVPIEKATVSYKVTRSLSYPYRYCWWYPPFPSNEKVVAVGQTETKNDGSFDIVFETLKDDLAKKEFGPITQYEIEVEVVDINGETRQGRATVLIGEKPVYIKTDIDNLRSVELKDFIAKAINAAGTSMDVKGHYEIHRLNKPFSQPKINRLWQPVDYQTLNQSEFSRDFQLFAYEDVSDMSKWEVGELVTQDSYHFMGEKQIQLQKSLPVGNFKISFFDDNDELISEEFFSTFSEKDRSASLVNQLSWQLDANSYKAGDVARLSLMSPWLNSVAQITIKHSSGEQIKKTVKFAQSLVSIDIPVEEMDRGGIVVSVTHIVHDRLVTENIHVPVPWTIKDFDVQWETFRDRTTPNAQEKFKVKITKKEGRFSNAEMLVTMYDKSLDLFEKNDWNISLWPTFHSYNSARALDGQSSNIYVHFERNSPPKVSSRIYPTFNDFFTRRYYGGLRYSADEEFMPMMRTNMKKSYDAVTIVADGEMEESAAAPPSIEESTYENEQFDFSPRENLNETVFFYPHIEINSLGEGVVEFTMNEALTTWKMNVFIHDKSLATGSDVQEVISQKELMVTPQLPRCFRSGDKIVLSTKVNRLSDLVKNIRTNIKLVNAISGEDVTEQFVSSATQSLSFDGTNSLVVNWTCDIPEDFVAPLYVTVAAASNEHQDAEKVLLEVVSNKVFLTEALPIHVSANQDKTIVFKTLKDVDLNNITYASFELTQNPIWFAIKSLPFIMNAEDENNEQLAHQYFANKVGTYIEQQNPSIKRTFAIWEKNGELISPLEQREQVKLSKLEETPWVRNAQSETQRAADLAKAFNENKLNAEAQSALERLMSNQLPNGGFSWFGNKYPSFHVTNTILLAIGQEKKITGSRFSRKVERMVQRAIDFSDRELEKRYNLLDGHGGYSTSNDVIRYLYIRSFFLDTHPIKNDKALDFYWNHISDIYNKSFSIQGMAGIAANRFNRKAMFNSIYASLNDKMIEEEEMGAFWKYSRSAYWHERPVEAHTILMELFSEAKASQKSRDQLSLWLLKNKQTNQWDNSTTTAKAIYALLMNSGRWMEDGIPVAAEVFGNEISTSKGFTSDYKELNTSAGTNYYQVDIDNKSQIKNAKVSLDNKNNHAVWGAVYAQYFKSIDQVDSYKETGLKVKKKLYKVVQHDDGEKMIEVTDDAIAVGDKIRVALDVHVDRDMEFVHVKDLRGIGFEPVDVISGYRSFGSSHAFQVTRDLSTNFYISYLPKGTHTFTYDVYAYNAGKYSDGLAQIQCMYAPEFIGRSQGEKISVNR